jgi:hypothetical protein
LLDFETNKKKEIKNKKTVTHPLAVTSPHAKWGVQLK